MFYFAQCLFEIDSNTTLKLLIWAYSSSLGTAHLEWLESEYTLLYSVISLFIWNDVFLQQGEIPTCQNLPAQAKYKVLYRIISNFGN